MTARMPGPCAWLALGALASCTPTPSRTGGAPEVSTGRCAAANGYVDRRGMFGTQMCVIPYADRGRPCSDSDECAGRCLLDYDRPDVSIITHPVGAEAAGQCEADRATFGCHAEIRLGRITQPICID